MHVCACMHACINMYVLYCMYHMVFFFLSFYVVNLRQRHVAAVLQLFEGQILSIQSLRRCTGQNRSPSKGPQLVEHAFEDSSKGKQVVLFTTVKLLGPIAWLGQYRPI
jgi:hypothetical protein